MTWSALHRLGTTGHNACWCTAGVARLPGVVIDVAEVESNIVVFRLAPGSPPPSAVVDRMKQAGVLVLGFRGGIRVVTHLQVFCLYPHRALRVAHPHCIPLM